MEQLGEVHSFNRPLISAIIPNYNHGHLIIDSIRALQEQTLSNFEAIIIDDGSTDGSVGTVSAAIYGDQRFKLLVNPVNIGVVATLNRGISVSKGEYIYLGAADDITDRSFFFLVHEFLKTNTHVAFGVAEVHLEHMDRKSIRHTLRPLIRPSNTAKHFSPSMTEQLLRKSDNWTVTGATLIRRSFLENESPLNVKLGSGADGFLLRRLALIHGFSFIPVIGLHWRRFDNGYSTRTLSDPSIFAQQINYYRDLMKSESIFPSWYVEKFRDRMYFSRDMYFFNNMSLKLKVINLYLPFKSFIDHRPFSICRLLLSIIGRLKMKYHLNRSSRTRSRGWGNIPKSRTVLD
jgi:glycosyltransferase involved in cell wall biosynthesis